MKPLIIDLYQVKFSNGASLELIWKSQFDLWEVFSKAVGDTFFIRDEHSIDLISAGLLIRNLTIYLGKISS